MKGTWHQCRLWAELDERSDELSQKLKLAVATAMPKIEEVLADRGTLSDFTLHDGWHSYRVAELIAQLSPEGLIGEMSSQELAMLLLAAYLHDIGMAPSVAKVEAHLAFVLSADSSRLSDDEVRQFQAWLDGIDDDFPLLASHRDSAGESLRRGREVVAAYIRHRHTELGAEWIEENLGNVEEPYAGWQDDLIELCKSHHFGIDRLRSATFAPRLVGSPATVLHLRYCACLLRVADVLDFDPERTPPILFRHRDVSDGSAIFWRKDQEIAFRVADGHVTLHARPSSAVVHRAIEQTVEDVNAELLLSRRLADETDFQHMAGSDRSLPHRWVMETTVRAVIAPRDDAYEYIDGTFRPHPGHLLELLGGLALYGSPFAAIREMLQNAFDAVREQIARERLLLPDPLDPQAVERLHAGHRVALHFGSGPSPGSYQLTCVDTGSGMSREIIRTRFLVGGAAASQEIRTLQRTCAERGFSVERTSRFGIGILSYFLIGSNLTVHTRRSLAAGDREGTGWTFTSDGLDDFGELKPHPDLHAGTKVVLELRDELVAGAPAAFAEQLVGYLKDTVKKTPCAFEFTASEPDWPGLSMGPGWAVGAEDGERLLLRNLLKDPRPSSNGERPLSMRKRQRLQREREEIDFARKDGVERFRPHVYEFSLPDELGAARVHLGSFELLAGPSLVYFSLGSEEDGGYRLSSIGDAEGIPPATVLSMSWNGMAIAPKSKREFSMSSLGALVEIDWTDDSFGRLSVHRNSFEPSGKAFAAMRWLDEEIGRLQDEILNGESEAPLALLNRLSAGAPAGIPARPWWPVEVGRQAKVLREIEPPVVALPPASEHDPATLRWRGAPVRVLPPVDVSGRRTTSWHRTLFQPTSLGVLRIEGEDRPVLVWDSIEAKKSSLFYRVAFPPEWKRLVSITFFDLPGHEFGTVWNTGHPLLRAADAGGLGWAMRLLWIEKENPLAHRAEILKCPSRVAGFLLTCIKGDGEILEAIQEQAPDFLLEAWDQVEGLAELEPIYSRTETDTEGGDLRIISPTSRESRYEPLGQQFQSLFPVEDDAWRLTVGAPASS